MVQLSCRHPLRISRRTDLDAFEDLGGRLLDVIQRLDQHFRIAVVEMDVVGAMVESVEPESPAHDMCDCFRFRLTNRLRRFLSTLGVRMETLMASFVDQR